MDQQASIGAARRSGVVRHGSGAGRTALSVIGTILGATGIAAALAGAAYLGLCAFTANGNTIWPGISVLGQDLGGLTVEEAATKLDNLVQDSSIDIYLYYEGTEPDSHDREPDRSLTFAELGFHPDTWQIAQDAYDMNVTEPDFFSLGWRYLTGEGERAFAPILHLDSGEEDLRAAEAAEALSYAPTDTTYYREDATLTVTMPVDGRAVNAEDVRVKLDTLLDNAPNFALDVPCYVVDHTVVTAQNILDDIYVPTRNAYYDKSTRAVAPEQVGVYFYPETVQAAMDAAAPGETIQMNIIQETPAITYDHLQSVIFRDVLGSATTSVGGSAARVNNVRLAASAINGTVLNAGEVFSYNGTVGQRTKARGYQEAPAYVQGQTVNEVGGGVCQPSSTLYLASLRSNMQITERYPHRYVPAYIPAGMDATVSWGGPDYKFTNNTDYPVKIQANYSGGSLTVKLIGTKTDNNHVEITNEFISSTPWKTEYRTDRSLPAGTSKVTTTPYTGYKYNTYRNIYDGNGNLISSKFEAVSNYSVRNQVISRNPG